MRRQSFSRSCRRAGISFVLALTAFNMLQGVEPSSTNPEWSPNGPVRYVSEYVVLDDGTGDDRKLIQRFCFSDSGRMTSVVRYGMDGRNPVTQTFTYDENGRLQSWIARDNDGTTLWGYRYRYTEDGRLLQETEFDRNGRVSGHRAFLYYQDEDGLRVEESAYDASGGVLWWMQRTRSSDANRETWTTYYPDGRVITEGIRRFDPRDRVISEEEIDRTDNSRITTSYEYDQGDAPILVEQHADDGRLLRREEFRYDERGNPLLHRIRTTPEDASGGERHVTRRYRYRYDEYGNWIHRTSWSMLTDGTRLEQVEHRVRIREYTYRE